MPTYLIDTSGRRKYRYREVAYGIPPSGRQPQMYEQSQFHAVDAHISFFLHVAPDTIKLYHEQRLGELIDNASFEPDTARTRQGN